MSHLVESMFSVRETPWHGLGIILERPPTVEDAIREAGLNWEVGFLPMEIILPDGTRTTARHRAVYRRDTGAVLGEVGPVWKPLQNAAKFAWFQPFVSSGAATLETAGALDEGRKTWVLAKLSRPNSEIVPGDEVVKFLMLSDSFDGTMAVRIGFTPVRVVCANTLASAHRDKASQLLRVRHSSQLQANLDDIASIVNAADAEFEATADQYRQLARRGINSVDLDKYVKTVLKLSPKDGKEELSTRARNILADIIGRFDGKGHGSNLPGVYGTYWGAYNAVTEYLSYERGHNQNSRLDSLWFGDSARKNAEALELALTMAG